jgi:hypothetical protein
VVVMVCTSCSQLEAAPIVAAPICSAAAAASLSLWLVDQVRTSVGFVLVSFFLLILCFGVVVSCSGFFRNCDPAGDLSLQRDAIQLRMAAVSTPVATYQQLFTAVLLQATTAEQVRQLCCVFCCWCKRTQLSTMLPS